VSATHGGARYILNSRTTRLPLLSPGTKLWLHGDHEPPNRPIYYPPTPQRQALRVQANGKLILGSLYDDVSGTSHAIEPLVVNEPRELCTDSSQHCGFPSTRIYHSIAVQANPPVRTRGGEQTTITLDATSYTLSTSFAGSELIDPRSNQCDAFNNPGIWVHADVMLDDVAHLPSLLTRRDALPVCVLGNDESPNARVASRPAPGGSSSLTVSTSTSIRPASAQDYHS
jgi:hypothetical protein